MLSGQMPRMVTDKNNFEIKPDLQKLVDRLNFNILTEFCTYLPFMVYA